MNAQDKTLFIHAMAKKNALDPEGKCILWSRHAVAELVNEGWARQPVEVGLQGCELIEDYPIVHRPLPDCLVLGWLDGQTPFHAVIAIDEAKARLLIVTVYQPSVEEWENEWRTRKR